MAHKRGRKPIVNLNLMMGFMLGKWLDDLEWYILYDYTLFSRLRRIFNFYQTAKNWTDWIDAHHLSYTLKKQCHTYYGEEFCFCEG